MKQLIIAEKPNIARCITSAIYEKFDKHEGYFESDNYIVTYCFGHLFQLWEFDDYFQRSKTPWNMEELPFMPKKFNYKIKNNDGCEKQYKIIEKLILRNDVNTIINAGDSDVEGQVLVNIPIFKALEKCNSSKKIMRLWIPDQSNETIRGAVKNLKPNEHYRNMYNEGIARAAMDWSYGIIYTRAVSLACQSTLPIGRVLTSIVKYIYDRYIEQQNFKVETFYTIAGLINKNDNSIKTTIKDIKFDKYGFKDAQILTDKLNQAKTIVDNVESKQINKQPPHLFSLDKLQSKMSNHYKWSNSKTLNILQKIYENGYVTYPRTNTEYLSENDKTKINKTIVEFSKLGYKVEMNNSKRIFDDSKIESHSAITPTAEKVSIASQLTGDEKVLYDVIKNRFLANFCSEKAIVNQIKVTLLILDQYVIELTGQTVIEQGYLQYESNVTEKTIPNFSIGEILKVKYSVEEGKTQPPKNVNIEELNNFMKNPFRKELKNSEVAEDDTISDDEEYKNILAGLEIGTVATRAGIIENAKAYEYIKEVKGIFTIQPKGIYLMQQLDKLQVDMSKEKTAAFGQMLKKISRNEATIDQCLESVKRDIFETVDRIKGSKVTSYSNAIEKEIIGKCPKCGKNIYESSKAFFCEGFKNADNKCTFSIFKENKFFKDKGKTVNKTIAKKLLKEKKVLVKGFKKKDGKRTYDAIVSMSFDEKYVNFKIDSFVNSNKK
ncbi:MAG: DNA topoisomerase [Candidatus Woesearchaeota archaeon]